MPHPYLNIDSAPPNYVPGQIVEVDTIDPYGFQGRDHHPEKSDKGKLCRVMVVEYGSDFEPHLRGSEDDYVMLTCEVINEARVLELVSHEVLIVEEPAR
jgi:hypothetical protein